MSKNSPETNHSINRDLSLLSSELEITHNLMTIIENSLQYIPELLNNKTAFYKTIFQTSTQTLKEFNKTNAKLEAQIKKSVGPTKKELISQLARNKIEADRWAQRKDSSCKKLEENINQNNNIKKIFDIDLQELKAQEAMFIENKKKLINDIAKYKKQNHKSIKSSNQKVELNAKPDLAQIQLLNVQLRQILQALTENVSNKPQYTNQINGKITQDPLSIRISANEKNFNIAIAKIISGEDLNHAALTTYINAGKQNYSTERTLSYNLKNIYNLFKVKFDQNTVAKNKSITRSKLR